MFRSGTIGGYTAAAVDGVELFSSTKKSCRKCLTRKNKAGQTEYFHRSVVCASIGHSPHVVLGQEMLTPRDGGEKDEGELTGETAGKGPAQEIRTFCRCDCSRRIVPERPVP